MGWSVLLGALFAVLALALGVVWPAQRRLIARFRQVEGDRLDLAERLGAAAKRLSETEGVARERDDLRALIDALPMPLWRRRRDLSLAEANRAYAAAVDADSADAVAEGRELAGAEGRALAARAQAKGVPQDDSRHVVIDGSRRYLALSEIPLADGGTLGLARDMTALQAAQAELQRHIAAHAAVLENVIVAIAIYGPDLRLAFYNTAFVHLWQLEPDWLAAKPSLEEVLERLRERRRLPEHADFRAFKAQQRAMFTALIEPQEELLHLPDERTLRLVVSPHPFRGLTFVFEDVTDRLALERSYNTSIAVQRETLNNLYEGIAVFGSDGRLKLWNPAYARIWRLAPEDLAGEPHISSIVERFRPFVADQEAWDETRRRIVARITAHSASSVRLERADGSVLQAATVPLPDGNILLSYLDITDSTRVEQALRERTAALETAGRLKSEFLANVSYELRTPLNAISGFAEILVNQYFGALNPRQTEYSQGILESAQRLSSLINDILDLATIEAGYMQIETREVDIHALMSSVMTLARERARNQSLRLDFDCPPDIGTLPADERRLKQALFNLVSNALKFTPAGGTVTLRARRESGGVALTVADTGIGVKQEDQARIFGTFERGSAREARQPGAGAGLGLSLVKSFVDLHGGTVELRSIPGTGTIVTCRIPAEAQRLREAGE